MAGLRSSTVRAGLPITRRTEPSSIRSASCRLLRKSAPQHSLWTAWTSLARPTPPTRQHQKRTCDVLHKPDIFTRYRQPEIVISGDGGALPTCVTTPATGLTARGVTYV